MQTQAPSRFIKVNVHSVHFIDEKNARNFIPSQGVPVGHVVRLYFFCRVENENSDIDILEISVEVVGIVFDMSRRIDQR